MFHARIKHLQIQYHFMKEINAFGKLNFENVRLKNQLVDVFIQLLGTTKFRKFKENIDVLNFKKT